MVGAPWCAEQTGHLLTPPSWDQRALLEYAVPGTDDFGSEISFLAWSLAPSFTFWRWSWLPLSQLRLSAVSLARGMTRGLLIKYLNHLLDTVMSIPSLLLRDHLCGISWLWRGSISCWPYVWHWSALYSLGLHCRAYWSRKDYILAATRLDVPFDFYLLWNSILPNILTVKVALKLRWRYRSQFLIYHRLRFPWSLPQHRVPNGGSILGDSVELIYLAYHGR